MKKTPRFLVKIFQILTALCWINSVQAEPDLSIPKMLPTMQNLYQLSKQDMTFEGKTFRLFIAQPKSITQPFTVLYTLDGNAQFPLAVNAVDPTKPLPLIVGIGYPTDKAYAIEQRTRDYTPLVEGEEFAKGGQASNFLRFIRDQAQPYVAQHYAINPQHQSFFGHSFGGLFGLYVLLNEPELFQSYTIASPSLWWGNSTFLPKQKPWIKQSPQHILITLGEYEENPLADPDLTEEQLHRINTRKAMRQLNAHQLAEELRVQGNNVDFILIPKKNHGGSIPDAIQQALQAVQNMHP